jgi:hypothetical protein
MLPRFHSTGSRRWLKDLPPLPRLGIHFRGSDDISIVASNDDGAYSLALNQIRNPASLALILLISKDRDATDIKVIE